MLTGGQVGQGSRAEGVTAASGGEARRSAMTGLLEWSSSLLILLVRLLAVLCKGYVGSGGLRSRRRRGIRAAAGLPAVGVRVKFPASCGLESKAAGSGRSQGTGRSFCAAPVKLGRGGALWSRRRRGLCAAGRCGRD